MMATKFRYVYFIIILSICISTIYFLIKLIFPFYYHAQIGISFAGLGLFIILIIILNEFTLLIFNENEQILTIYKLKFFPNKRYKYEDIYGYYFTTKISKGILSRGIVYYLMDGELISIDDQKIRNFDALEAFTINNFNLISWENYRKLNMYEIEKELSVKEEFHYSQLKNIRYWMIFFLLFISIFLFLSLEKLMYDNHVESTIQVLFILTVSFVYFAKKFIFNELKIRKMKNK